MENILGGSVAVVMGLYLVIRHTPFARESIEFQNRVFKRRYGEREIRVTAVLYHLMGYAVILMGVLGSKG